MRVLVTGANGFVGRALVRHLWRAGHEVTALDLQDSKAFGPSVIVAFIAQDIGEPFRLKRRFDAVCHLAAHNVTHVGERSRELYQRVNVGGTRNVVEAAEGADMLFLSTVKVYATAKGNIDENAALKPTDAYAESKLSAEETLQSCARRTGRRWVIFRSTNIIGAGQPAKALVPVLLGRARRGEPLEIFGPKDALFEFLDVDDAAEAFIMTLGVPAAQGIFNIAGRDRVQLSDLIVHIVQLTKSSSVVRYSNTSPVADCWIDCQRAAELLGWSAQVPFEEALLKCARAYGRENTEEQTEVVSGSVEDESRDGGPMMSRGDDV